MGRLLRGFLGVGHDAGIDERRRLGVFERADREEGFLQLAEFVAALVAGVEVFPRPLFLIGHLLRA